MDGPREAALRLLGDMKSAGEVAGKTERLKLLLEFLVREQPGLVSEFLPYLLELHTDPSPSTRELVTKIMEEIGSKFPHYATQMVPVLTTTLQDSSPSVAKHTLMAATVIFRTALEQVALQGLDTGQVDKPLQKAWEAIYPIRQIVQNMVLQSTNDGVRLHALKFMESVIMLFTADPTAPSRPPRHRNADVANGSLPKSTFNIGWISGGHPSLDMATLAQEGSKSLGQLLTLLKPPAAETLPGPVAIVLLNSLTSIAKQRPVYFGRIVPAIISLAPDCKVFKAAQLVSVVHTLKTGLLALLKCTHQNALPWRDRLAESLRGMNAGELADSALRRMDRAGRNADRSGREQKAAKEEQPPAGPGPRERKRSLSQENGTGPSAVPSKNGDGTADPVKRQKLEPTNRGPPPGPPTAQPITAPSTGGDPSVLYGADSGLSPLQRMVGMLGQLVEKGEKAMPSVELLVNNLPPDLLADVVITYMQHLPLSRPEAGGGAPAAMAAGGGGQEEGLSGETAQVRRDPRRDPRRQENRRPSPSSVKSEFASVKVEDQASQPLPPITTIKQEYPTEASGPLPPPPSSLPPFFPSQQPHQPHIDPITRLPIPYMSDSSTGPPPFSHPLPPSAAPSHPVLLVPKIEEDDEETADGASGPAGDLGLDGTGQSSALTSLGMPAWMAAASGGSMGVGLNISPLVVSDEERKKMRKSAHARILAAQKSLTCTGASALRMALLARLAVEFPLEDGVLTELLEHILADYSAHQGPDLALAVLFQLFSKCHDFAARSPPGTLALPGDVTNVTFNPYTSFALSLVKGLLKLLPPTDRSLLPRLLCDAPSIPPQVLSLLRSLCVSSLQEAPPVPKAAMDGRPAGKGEGEEGEEEGVPMGGERVSQALVLLGNLTIQRPPLRSACLETIFECTLHKQEEVRSKAVRLAVNKLFQIPHLSSAIEEFAIKQLHLVSQAQAHSMGPPSSHVSMRDSVPSKGLTETANLPEPSGPSAMEVDTQGGSHVAQSGASISVSTSVDPVEADGSVDEEKENVEPSKESGSGAGGGVGVTRGAMTVADVQRHLALFFALTTKKASLLVDLFKAYSIAPKATRQVIMNQVPVLIKPVGPTSEELLNIISDPPVNSGPLVRRALHCLVDNATPSPDLIKRVLHLYSKRPQEPEYLIPILSLLSRDEVLPVFPKLMAMPLERFQAALARILQGSTHSGPALTPAEVIIAVHGVDSQRDGLPLKKIMEICTACLNQRSVFTHQVLAKALNQLVEQTPLPKLFMRTVLLSVGNFPQLKTFVVDILSRLVHKQIWKDRKLWEGFVKCASQTAPESFNVLLKLPAGQLEDLLGRAPSLKEPLAEFAGGEAVRTLVPRALLVLLGKETNQNGESSASTNPVGDEPS